jgi:hypothetical protein
MQAWCERIYAGVNKRNEETLSLAVHREADGEQHRQRLGRVEQRALSTWSSTPVKILILVHESLEGWLRAAYRCWDQRW